MKFEMWSLWHYVYLAMPFIMLVFLWLFTRKATDKARYIVGIIIGLISIGIIVIRNVDIYLRQGWDLEVIPLQVCHIGSIIVGLALIFRKKWLLLTAFCFNVIPAILAMVFADSLANYDTILKIRPQTYIWGHIFIVVGAVYGVVAYSKEFKRKDMCLSLLFVFICLVAGIVCNNTFRLWFGWEPNYFYLYNYKGTPLSFLYNVIPTSTYGWFAINWVYTGTLIAVFVVVYLMLYFVAKKLSKIKR